MHHLPADWRETLSNDVHRDLGSLCVCVGDEGVCVCCWHVFDAIVEMSVLSIYLFVRRHIKALNRAAVSLSHFVVASFSHIYIHDCFVHPNLVEPARIRVQHTESESKYSKLGIKVYTKVRF